MAATPLDRAKRYLITPRELLTERRSPGWIRAAIAGLLLLATIWGAVLRYEGWHDWWANPDEGIYLDITGMTPDDADRAIAGNAHPPLQFWLLRAVASIDGDITSLRMPSLIAGVLLIPMMFLLCAALAGIWAGLFGAVLIAFSPGCIMLSQVTRPYMLHTLLIAAALWFLVRYLRSSRARELVGYAVAMTLAVLLHYATFVVIGGLGLFILVWLLTSRPGWKTFWQLALANLPVLGTAAALYLLHVSKLQGGGAQAEAQRGWLAPYFVNDGAEALRALRRSCVFVFGRGISMWVIPLATLGLLLHPNNHARRFAGLSVLVVLVALVMSFLAQYPLGWSRHSVYLAVFWTALAAGCVGAWLQHPRRVLAGAMVVFCLLVSYRMVRAGGVQDATPILPERIVTRASADAAARAIDEQMTSGDLLIMDAQSTYLILPLLSQRLTFREIAGAQPHSGADANGRRFVRLDFWRASGMREDKRDVHHLENALDLLDQADDPAWRPSRVARVWIVQAGYAEAVLRRLPSAVRAGDPGRGNANLFLARFDPAAYSDYLAADED